jgi:hypothetical protein
MPNDGRQTGGASTRVNRRLAQRRNKPKNVWGLRCFPSIPLAERLRLRVVEDPETGCHEWGGPRFRNGYGRVEVTAHRLTWEVTRGPVPRGMLVLHRCDNPSCCNPEHLFLGTPRDNMIDKIRKGRGRNQWTGKLPRKPRRPGPA